MNTPAVAPWEQLARVIVTARLDEQYLAHCRSSIIEHERCPNCPALNTIARTQTGHGALTTCTSCGWHYLDTGDLTA